MLDNAVAGGIASGESPFESLVRECGEEASLDEELVRTRAKACGTVTYWYIRDERAGGETNLMQPEVQYVYDLELPEGTTPKPGDDEVEEFYLWSVEEVQEAMRKGEFKPNCAMVVLDFLIRHGILTTESERDYIEIVSRLHRKLEFPTL
jgi:8-oxo-dGTP pyrophosphatase MutT (NUDIX family)